MTADPGALEVPVWFEPLRAPSWLVPPVRGDAPVIVFCAEPWDERAVDVAGRDLRLGLPLFLAEATRFGTGARPIAVRHAVAGDEAAPDASVIVRSAVSPDGVGSVRLRMADHGGAVLGEVSHLANDEAALGAALTRLPHAVSEAAAPRGVRPIWSSLYTLPSGVRLVSYVRGLHACLRVVDATPPRGANADVIAQRRADVIAVLAALGALATSTPEPFPALVFFGALLAARDAGWGAVGEFRLQANARCTAATDPFDPVFAMTALVARVFGDRDTSERRLAQLAARAAPDDEAMRSWLERVEAVT